jgi:hypothetical protein
MKLWSWQKENLPSIAHSVRTALAATRDGFSENKYTPRGLGGALMKSITSSTLLASEIGKIGPKISSCIAGEFEDSMTAAVTSGNRYD